MKTSAHFKTLALALALAIPALAVQAAEPSADTCQFSVTPYLFLPNINGTLKYQLPAGNPEVRFGPNDYLQALNYAFVISGDARTGDWGLLTDFIILDSSNEKSRVKSVTGLLGNVYSIGAGTQTSLHGMAWELAGFYNLLSTPKASMDVLAGSRYAKVDTSLSWQLSGPCGLFPPAGKASKSTDLTDAIVGVRGRVRLGDGKWYVPYYPDAGAGSSSTTWQGLVGVAKRSSGELRNCHAATSLSIRATGNSSRICAAVGRRSVRRATADGCLATVVVV